MFITSVVPEEPAAHSPVAVPEAVLLLAEVMASLSVHFPSCRRNQVCVVAFDASPIRVEEPHKGIVDVLISVLLSGEGFGVSSLG
jgi:hypothetical protein